MNNIHHQAGEASVTSNARVEAKDGMLVRLLPGTKRGQAGQIVTLSRQTALAEIQKGFAVSLE